MQRPATFAIINHQCHTWRGAGHPHGLLPHAHCQYSPAGVCQNLTANDDAMKVRHIGHAALALAMTSSAHALHVHCTETQGVNQAACQDGASDSHHSAEASSHICVKAGTPATGLLRQKAFGHPTERHIRAQSHTSRPSWLS